MVVDHTSRQSGRKIDRVVDDVFEMNPRETSVGKQDHE
jgi:hypothetical protein